MLALLTSTLATATSYDWLPVAGSFDGAGCCRASCDGSPPFDESHTCVDLLAENIVFYGSAGADGHAWVPEDECVELYTELERIAAGLSFSPPATHDQRLGSLLNQISIRSQMHGI